MMNKQPGQYTALLVLVGCCLALPAAAEGGSYPSLEFLVAVGLGYLLLIPIVATSLVYGTMKLRRPQIAIRPGRVFAAAFVTWVGLMLVFNYSNLSQYLSDNQAIGIGGVVVLAAAFVTAYLTRPAKRPTA